MRNSLLIPALLFVCLGSSGEQQPGKTSAAAASSATIPTSPQVDLATIAIGIRDSYYHPDDLSSLTCAVDVDWDALAAQLKTTASNPRIEALKKAKVKVRAERGKAPRVDLSWAADDLPNKEVLEQGMRKALSGFFQMYWSLDASFLAPTAEEKPKLEARPDGGYLLHFNSGDARVIEEVDKRNVITRVSFTSPASSASPASTTKLEPRFSDAPNDISGHPRLLTAVDVSQQTGDITVVVHVALDYQSVGGVHIPSHVTFALADSYTFALQFTGCSVTRAVKPRP